MSWLEDHWKDIVAMSPVKSGREPCAVAACDRPSQALGLCTPHYTKARQQFDPEFRERYLAAKRSRERAKRRAKGGVAGQPEQARPDARGPSPRPRRAQPGTGTGRAS